MSEILERLRNRGWRLTAQRRAVAEVLSASPVHLTADQVHQRAAKRLPEISLATVYNTLHELARMGEVREVALDGRACRYDPNALVAHDHLVCRSCGTIRDIPKRDASPEPTKEESDGFEVSSVEVVYRGLCRRCRLRQRRSA
ncbi:MAG: transcriptional repressor [Actinobacteria bacterium]|nr:MAG: transcriptional repressor [Actinomycetota bacterium]RIK02490.1 MAG: transcriptional repressor [Acidobacteriota bacterium]